MLTMFIKKLTIRQIAIRFTTTPKFVFVMNVTKPYFRDSYSPKEAFVQRLRLVI